MKFTKSMQSKLGRLRLKHPSLHKLYSSTNMFAASVSELLDEYSTIYGADKIINRFIKCCLLDQKAYSSIEDFIDDIQVKLADMIYKEFEQNLNKSNNNIITYFNDVKKVYADNNQFKDKIDFTLENRDKLIKSNLKLVVATAKRYMGMGVPFEDLICAGNLGLCVAFDKFKSQKNSIRDSILEDIRLSNKTSWSKSDFHELLQQYYTYGDFLDKLEKKIPAQGFNKISDLKLWINKNIKTAVFASVAFMWIRAFILIEINKNAHVVKLTKDDDIPAKSKLISISELNDQNNVEFDMPSDDYEIMCDDINNSFRNNHLKEIVGQLLNCLSARERRIVIKRFGIGLPGPLRINEIAEDENISTSRCNATYKEAINKMIEFANNNSNVSLKETLKELL